MCEDTNLNKYPKYSVLMTVYKKDNPLYFQIALDSMINQSIKPDEIIIVKDGPVTNEIQSIINFRKEKGKINELQLKENIGLGLALNEGIKICKNELIARMDADDISLPKRCEKQLEMFNKNPKLDIVGLPVIEFNHDINDVIGRRNVPISNDDIYKFARTRDPFNHPTVMYRKSKLIEVGCYSNYRKNQDTDLWLKLLKNKAYCANLNDYLFYFRFDENTYKKRKNWLNTKLLIEIRYNAYKNHLCSFYDFFKVMIVQFIIFILPINLQKTIYRKVLRD